MNPRTSIPIQSFDASTTQAGATVSLPPKTFNDPDFFDFEMDAVWGHEWFCIGHVNDIPKPGDYYTISVGRDPLLVVRQQDGSVKVLANVCQHRGLLLAEGRGNVRRIRCPMHSWVYDLSGALTSAPGLNDDPTFDKKQSCLPVIRSEIWEGFLFVTFDTDIAPLAPRLQRLKEQLANYQMATLHAAEPLTMEFNEWNWKQYMDEWAGTLGEGDAVFVCGPLRLLDDLVAIHEARPVWKLHLERFENPNKTAAGGDAGFDLVLARSGKTYRVEPGETILDVLRRDGWQLEWFSSSSPSTVCRAWRPCPGASRNLFKIPARRAIKRPWGFGFATKGWPKTPTGRSRNWPWSICTWPPGACRHWCARRVAPSRPPTAQ